MAAPFTILPIVDNSEFVVRPIRFVGGADDITPDDFSFTSLVNQPVSTQVTSNIVTITGLSDSLFVDAVINYGQSDLTAAISKNGGPFVQADQEIVNGDTIQLRVQSSSSSGGLVRVSITVGDVTAQWLVSNSGTVELPDTIWFSRSPFALARTTTAIAVAFSATEAGDYRVIVTAFGQVPSLAEVLAGTGQGGVTPLFDSGFQTMAAFSQYSEYVSGLTPGTAYSFHVALRDELQENTAIGRVSPVTTLAVVVDPNGRLHTPNIAANISPQIGKPISARIM